MNKRTLAHVGTAVLGLALLTAWFYLSSWVHAFFAHVNGYVKTPSQVLSYWQSFGGYDKSFWIIRLVLGGSSLTLFIVGVIEIYKDRRALHGDARFATWREIRKAGLLARKGLLIGYHMGKYLVSGGQDFVLLAAPTRSGKGVSMVIPNLLNWPESAVTMDTKLENWKTTSKYRQEVLKQETYLFNPFAADRKSHRWNPLGEVRRDPVLMGGDVLQIAQVFYPERAGDRNPFFTQQAQNLFFGLTMYLLETNHTSCTLAEVFRQGSGYDKPVREHVQGILDDNPNLSRACRDALNRFVSSPDETFGNIKSSFDAPLLMLANPLVEMATSACDFRLADVRKIRMSIYFGITPNRLPLAERLTNLFFTQLISLNTEVLPEDDKSLRYQCVLLNDEFTAFGRIQILVKAVSFIAGYGLRLVTILQSKSQPEGDNLYSRPDVRNLIVNHDVKVLFTPGDDLEAKDASEMLGTYTTKVTSYSSSRNGTIVAVNTNSNSGDNTSEQKRALMMPNELKRMPMDEQIIDKKGLRPIHCKKIRYYADSIFVDRLKLVSPMLRALGNALPTKEQLDQARISGELSAPVNFLQVEQSAARQINEAILESEKTVMNQEALSANEQLQASVQILARDISDWSAWSSASEVKAHLLKTFFMQDFMKGENSAAA
jgi:type IV secretion system protein VirD4